MFTIGTLIMLFAIAIIGILFLIVSFTNGSNPHTQVETYELLYLLPLVPILIYLAWIVIRDQKGDK
ncbi:hypothetical protein ABC345_18380 [Shouchella sp. 1P09AA]|uniref:hypothetical protein n=1 Tax=unclassified Shouchella TaxID=2893065 RepID=UPI0039A2BAC5